MRSLSEDERPETSERGFALVSPPGARSMGVPVTGRCSRNRLICSDTRTTPRQKRGPVVAGPRKSGVLAPARSMPGACRRILMSKRVRLQPPESVRKPPFRSDALELPEVLALAAMANTVEARATDVAPGRSVARGFSPSVAPAARSPRPSSWTTLDLRLGPGRPRIRPPGRRPCRSPKTRPRRRACCRRRTGPGGRRRR